MQVYAWMDFQVLIFGIWLQKCFILHQTNWLNNTKAQGQGNLSRQIKTKNLWITRFLSVQGKLQHQDTQETQEIFKTRKPKVEFGHIISMYHQTLYLTWRKSSRLWDNLLVEVRRVIWMTSMWIQRYGIFVSVTLQAADHPGQDFFGKSAINQESTLEVCETIISNDREVDQGSVRNYRIVHDWLEAAHVERDYTVNCQSCSICDCQNLRLFRLSAVSWRYQYWTSPSMEKQD